MMKKLTFINFILGIGIFCFYSCSSEKGNNSNDIYNFKWKIVTTSLEKSTAEPIEEFASLLAQECVKDRTIEFSQNKWTYFDTLDNIINSVPVEWRENNRMLIVNEGDPTEEYKVSFGKDKNQLLLTRKGITFVLNKKI